MVGQTTEDMLSLETDWYGGFDPFELDHEASAQVGRPAKAPSVSSSRSSGSHCGDLDEAMLIGMVNPFDLEAKDEEPAMVADKTDKSNRRVSFELGVCSQDTSRTDISCSASQALSEFWQDTTADRARSRKSRLRLSLSSQRDKIRLDDEEALEERMKEVEGDSDEDDEEEEEAMEESASMGPESSEFWSLSRVRASQIGRILASAEPAAGTESTSHIDSMYSEKSHMAIELSHNTMARMQAQLDRRRTKATTQASSSGHSSEAAMSKLPEDNDVDSDDCIELS